MCAHDGQLFRLNVNGFSVCAEYTQEEVCGILDSVLDTLSAIHARKTPGERTVAFFAGPPGAGKSTLCLALEMRAAQRGMPHSFQTLGLDGFHKKSEVLKASFIVREGRSVCLGDIKGAPETFEADGFLTAVAGLKLPGKAFWPVYDRTIHDVSREPAPVTGEILLIEGNWLLLPGTWARARAFSDRSYAVTAQEKLLKERLISRKMRGGKTYEQARAWYEKVDGPNVSLFYRLSGKPDEAFVQNAGGRLERTACTLGV